MNQPTKAMRQIDVQGHRGCRGLFPENTIPGFLHALDLGVHTLEMDVVTSGDDHVIVSHEPYFHHDISLDPEGNEISAANEQAHNIFLMTVEEIQQYDVGSKSHPDYPQQAKLRVHKPTLREVFFAVEEYLVDNNMPPVQYSIEIKRKPETDSKMHAAVTHFVDLVHQVIEDSDLIDRCLIQSFDIETLQILNEKYPYVRLVYLIDNQETLDDNMKVLGLTPEVYSPEFVLLDVELVNQVHKSGMKIVPWTVNDPEDIKTCLELDIDGIISDYPNRVFDLLKQD